MNTETYSGEKSPAVRIQPILEHSLEKLKKFVPALSATVLTVSGCAVLPGEAEDKRFLVQSLVQDVERASAAVETYYANKPTPVRFEKSTVTIATEYVETASGEVTAVLAFSGSKSSTANDSIVINLGRGNRSILRKDLSESGTPSAFGFSAAFENAIFDDVFECGERTQDSVEVRSQDETWSNERSFAEQLALLVISGANGYTCAVKDGANLSLTDLTVTAGYKVVVSDSGGLELEIGPVTAGATVGKSQTGDNKISMVFSPR